MKKFKILNLYACLGGNRYKWDEVAKAVGIKIEVTAVELDTELGKLYQERFPDDIVIVADAHQYLLDNYKEFDFIWSSPPCPTHSRARFWNSSNYDTATLPVYPDLKLYEEILFLKHYCRKGYWIVENVIPFYEPLIPAMKRGRHLYWSNLKLPADLGDRRFQISTANLSLEACVSSMIMISKNIKEIRELIKLPVTWLIMKQEKLFSNVFLKLSQKK